jgi:hypothetical protein
MFTKAMVLIGQGTDKVFITTDKPSAISGYLEPLTLTFEATKGTGEDYVRKNFGLNPEIVDRGGKLQPRNS